MLKRIEDDCRVLLDERAETHCDRKIDWARFFLSPINESAGIFAFKSLTTARVLGVIQDGQPQS